MSTIQSSHSRLSHPTLHDKAYTQRDMSVFDGTMGHQVFPTGSIQICTLSIIHNQHMSWYFHRYRWCTTSLLYFILLFQSKERIASSIPHVQFGISLVVIELFPILLHFNNNMLKEQLKELIILTDIVVCQCS